MFTCLPGLFLIPKVRLIPMTYTVRMLWGEAGSSESLFLVSEDKIYLEAMIVCGKQIIKLIYASNGKSLSEMKRLALDRDSWRKQLHWNLSTDRFSVKMRRLYSPEIINAQFRTEATDTVCFRFQNRLWSVSTIRWLPLYIRGRFWGGRRYSALTANLYPCGKLNFPVV